MSPGDIGTKPRSSADGLTLSVGAIGYASRVVELTGTLLDQTVVL